MAKKSGKPNFDHALRELNTKIMRMPGSIQLRLERASLYQTMGRFDDARKAYEELLVREPANFTALTNLALLLYKNGHAVEAFERYKSAALHHPSNAVAQANLAFMLAKGGDLAAARERYRRAVELDPKNHEALRGLATVEAQLGESSATATPVNPVVVVPFRGSGKPLRVLVPVTLHAGNVRTDRLLDDSLFAVTKLVVDQIRDSVDVPAHDVIFNAIADADDAPEALTRANALLQSATAPILNRPARVSLTGRAANAERFRKLPNVRAPRIEAFERAAMTGASLEGRGFTFPLLLRSSGYHSGEHFVRVDEAAALAEALEDLPGDRLLAIEYIDSSAQDGTFRKYRAMFVNGSIYPLHLAIGRDWKVHYFSSEMRNDPAFREEEARYLANLPDVIGETALNALQALQRLLELEYAGVDFALTRDGEPIIFEANATMVVPAPPEEPEFAYRRPAIATIVSAFQQMVVQRGSRTPA